VSGDFPGAIDRPCLESFVKSEEIFWTER
jgi:hypothetical protein